MAALCFPSPATGDNSRAALTGQGLSQRLVRNLGATQRRSMTPGVKREAWIPGPAQCLVYICLSQRRMQLCSLPLLLSYLPHEFCTLDEQYFAVMLSLPAERLGNCHLPSSVPLLKDAKVRSGACEARGA